MTDAEIRKLIDDTLNNLPCVTIPNVYWGACDLTYYPDWGQRYNRGIAVVIPFFKMMTLKDHTEDGFALLEMTTYRYRLEVSNALTKAFTEAGIDFDIPLVFKDHEIVYHAQISAKDIAVHAGLGWIGKNDLLITPEYGPRVSLVGLVLNCDELIPGTPVTESRCGECDACVHACPFKNFTGREWAPGRPREERVNYVRCSEMRGRARKVLGRKMACGKCIVSCPVGAPAEQ
ncbi:MAG: epoxyqueuosine reductase [Lachnospiraceae bacterium]|nr:epoxyqueuosine reductase [Lachnospiraceae bacterium]